MHPDDQNNIIVSTESSIKIPFAICLFRFCKGRFSHCFCLRSTSFLSLFSERLMAADELYSALDQLKELDRAFGSGSSSSK